MNLNLSFVVGRLNPTIQLVRKQIYHIFPTKSVARNSFCFTLHLILTEKLAPFWWVGTLFWVYQILVKLEKSLGRNWIAPTYVKKRCFAIKIKHKLLNWKRRVMDVVKTAEEFHSSEQRRCAFLAIAKFISHFYQSSKAWLLINFCSFSSCSRKSLALDLEQFKRNGIRKNETVKILKCEYVTHDTDISNPLQCVRALIEKIK